jgi:thioredoxin 1
MLVRKFIYVAAVTLIGAMATACSNGSSSKSATESTDSVDAEAVEVPSDDELPTPPVANLQDDNLIRPDKAVDDVVFLDFNATWCVPCKKFAPAFESTAEKYNGKAKFYSVDIDVNPETAKAFGVESVPTLVILKKDGTVDRYVGIGDLLPAEKFEAIVEKAI